MNLYIEGVRNIDDRIGIFYYVYNILAYFKIICKI
jgi:hypothetical protein